MKHSLPAICSLLLALSLLAGCADEPLSFDPTESQGTSATVAVDFSQTDDDMFTDRDNEATYSQTDAVLIQLNGDSATATSDSVKISGSTVTITEDATYILSGTLNDGMIIVDTPDTAKPQLVLSSADIHSSTSAALYILEADKVFLTLAEGTENSLSNGGSFTAIDDNNIDAALFSKQDLTINGSGSLTVTSPAGHGIVSKDDLAITGGSYLITAASHGLDANDSVRISSGSLSVTAGKDGIHAENSDDAVLGFVYISGGTIQAEAEGDGISASAYLQITGGSFSITAGGGSANAPQNSSQGGFMGGGMGRPGGMGGMSGNSSSTTEDTESMKAMKAAGDLCISGGEFTIDSADDAVHSNASILVEGGTFTIATGDDGFHADDTLTINTGTITITKSYEGLEGLHIVVAGGDITLTASDDGLNAAGGTDQSGAGGFIGGDKFGRPGGPGGGMPANSNGSITISGGTLYVNASGDGIDANGNLLISGGHTTVVGPTQGDTATLDYDTSATITGGTFIGTGASGMAQTFSDAQQGIIAVKVGNNSAGTLITLTDTDGNTLLSYSPELSFAVLILSSPDITPGGTYTITVGQQFGQIEAS